MPRCGVTRYRSMSSVIDWHQVASLQQGQGASEGGIAHRMCKQANE